jgi:hypothetical protein
MFLKTHGNSAKEMDKDRADGRQAGPTYQLNRRRSDVQMLLKTFLMWRVLKGNTRNGYPPGCEQNSVISCATVRFSSATDEQQDEVYSSWSLWFVPWRRVHFTRAFPKVKRNSPSMPVAQQQQQCDPSRLLSISLHGPLRQP